MRNAKLLIVGLLALVGSAARAEAQSLPVSLFERYLEALRTQTGIPGISAAIVQDGRIVWDQGFGYQDIETQSRARSDTPYPILDLSQTLSSTVLLHQCLDLGGRLDVSDKVKRWFPTYPDDTTTVGQLLSHAASGAFRYDVVKYAALTTVIAQCTSDMYPRVLAREVLDRLGMKDTVPGHDLGSGSSDRGFFTSKALDDYGTVLRRVATPYHVDRTGRASLFHYSPPALSASTGVVSTVLDLARFDEALDADSVLIDPPTRDRAWQPAGPTPTGLGWFVQSYNRERIVWHFGLMRDAYSALYIKVPSRKLTLILLANSDGLAAPYTLANGDLTASLFAQAFLQLFIP